MDRNIGPTLKLVMHVISVTRLIAIFKKTNNRKSIVGPKDTGPLKELYQADVEQDGRKSGCQEVVLQEKFEKNEPEHACSVD